MGLFGSDPGRPVDCEGCGVGKGASLAQGSGEWVVELCCYYEQADESELGEGGGALAASWRGKAELNG